MIGDGSRMGWAQLLTTREQGHENRSWMLVTSSKAMLVDSTVDDGRRLHKKAIQDRGYYGGHPG
uniref:Uncharacterized protein n=1 Tax=Oryza sativa subsp. japonica TaxID=39947 RepID=Q655W7_ORYSJ|nr:hypothetical protein [Oryza sativa Japonica Group]